MKLFYSISILIFSFAFNFVSAQNYNIEINIKGVQDTSIYLAHYYDGRVFADDTTFVNKKGNAIFSNDSLLMQGIYIVYLPGQKYFDILIGEDQNFKISTDTTNFIGKMKIEGSKESKAFLSFQKFMQEQNIKGQQLKKEYNKIKDNKIKKAEYLDIFKKQDKQVKEYIKQISEDFPEPYFVSKFTKMTLSPEIPDFDKIIAKDIKSRDKLIQEKAYYYNREHYFDNIDFTDERFLLTPMLKNKLDFFFGKMLIQNPDTVSSEAIKIIEKANSNKKFFQYLTQYSLNYGIKSKIMGMDAAFVNIAKKYYLSGRAIWADSSLMAQIKERVIKLQYNLIGKKAKDLILETPEGEHVSLYELDAKYTILYFWEPDCGHCKKVTPKLKTEIYDKFKDKGVKVFAVYTQSKKQIWEDFIAEKDLFELTNCYDPNFTSNFRVYYDVYSTPIIYLLDKEKKIIAKRLDIESLTKFLNHELNL